ncbi:MAG: hypothetical protein MUF85_00880 [Patescibacteria group bacterium]|jgi:hypothetical protein|nr:hypothetical protein [Patescibacteria group bacterium]
MQLTTKILTSLLVGITLLLAILISVQTVNAQETQNQEPVTITVDGESTNDADSQDQNNSDQEENSQGNYEFTAQPGDSYSVMARKAVQIFGIDNKVNLSGAQIVFTETNLTQAADSPQLNQGEIVKISKESVKSWVEKALVLTESQQAAWNIYVPYVNFDTSNVGE